MFDVIKIKDKIPVINDLSTYKLKRKSLSLFISIFRLLILLAIGYVVIYPFMYMLTSAIRTGNSYYDPTITWLTTKVTFDNFIITFKVMDYLNSLKNTILYELVAAIIQLMSCAIAAYGFARFDFKEKKLYWILLYITILLPVQATMLPTYINYSHMDFLGILEKLFATTGIDLRPNILNTPLVFYLPALFGVGLRSGIIIFIYIQFFKGLPRELEEAAWIDGCGPFMTFVRIALPSSTVVIFTNLIFSVIWHWNDYFLAAMYLKDQSKFTLAVSLAEIQNSLAGIRFTWNMNSPSTGAMIMAACTLYVLPMLIMYIILQKNFVKSIDRVGITG